MHKEQIEKSKRFFLVLVLSIMSCYQMGIFSKNPDDLRMILKSLKSLLL